MVRRRWLAVTLASAAAIGVASCQGQSGGPDPSPSSATSAEATATTFAQATPGSRRGATATATGANGAPWVVTNPGDLTQWPDMCTTWSDAELQSALPVAVTIGRSGQKGHSWSVQDPVGNVMCTFTMAGSDRSQTWAVTIETEGFGEPAATGVAFREGKDKVPVDAIVDYGTSLGVANAYWHAGSLVALLEGRSAATVLTLAATVPSTGPGAPTVSPEEAERRLCAALTAFVADNLSP